MLHDLLIAAPSLLVGFLIGWCAPRKTRYTKAPITVPVARGRQKNLRFMFTLDGDPTGEMVPEGEDPSAVAILRSLKTGKAYGARRV